MEAPREPFALITKAEPPPLITEQLELGGNSTVTVHQASGAQVVWRNVPAAANWLASLRTLNWLHLEWICKQEIIRGYARLEPVRCEGCGR